MDAATGSGRAGSARVTAWIAGAVIAAVTLLMPVGIDAAKTDIRIDYDKKFSFAGLKRWTWHPDGPGDVRLAFTSNDDPKRVASRVEPVVVPAVERQLKERGLERVADTPDLYVHYYMLGTVGELSQVHGQFLPAVPEWGLPPFLGSSSALTVYRVGTLVIDITTAANREIVWRGSAERKIDFESPDQKRREVLERAVRDLLKGFPPKP
jgi:hypothetical protein